MAVARLVVARSLAPKAMRIKHDEGGNNTMDKVLVSDESPGGKMGLRVRLSRTRLSTTLRSFWGRGARSGVPWARRIRSLQREVTPSFARFSNCIEEVCAGGGVSAGVWDC